MRENEQSKRGELRGELRGDPRGDLVYALSLKQPWAALLVGGGKTIEVRKWAAVRRGRILIHASGVPSDDPVAWAKVPPELIDLAKLNGGLLGEGELTACVAYRSQEAFAADCAKHLNEAEWFQPPVLYGFVFAGLKVTPFVRCKGWMRFFPIPPEVFSQDEDGEAAQ